MPKSLDNWFRHLRMITSKGKALSSLGSLTRRWIVKEVCASTLWLALLQISSFSIHTLKDCKNVHRSTLMLYPCFNSLINLKALNSLKKLGSIEEDCGEKKKVCHHFSIKRELNNRKSLTSSATASDLQEPWHGKRSHNSEETYPL